MGIFSELKRVIKFLDNYPGQWAVCGGVAASIYRERPRFTDDIDFALVDNDSLSARDLALKVISDLGYRDYHGFIPDPLQKGRQINALICARSIDDKKFEGFDFLLPIQSWIDHAVSLAQNNMIDFGFAKLPTVTPEYLILAKMIALNSNAERHQDIDDIKEIIKSNPIDYSFIREQINNSGIVFEQTILALIAK